MTQRLQLDFGEPYHGETRSLRIEVTQAGVYLFRLDVSGVSLADTWHLSVEDAMQQAAFEFGVANGCSWKPVAGDESG